MFLKAQPALLLLAKTQANMHKCNAPNTYPGLLRRTEKWYETEKDKQDSSETPEGHLSHSGIFTLSTSKTERTSGHDVDWD